MAVLTVELSFPHAPITSLHKRLVKGVEQLYYAKLFVTNPAYDTEAVWSGWHGLGFHLATFDPPPGVAASDRVRVRLKAPSARPQISATSDNVDALKDLQGLLELVDAVRPSLAGLSRGERREAVAGGELGRVLLALVAERLAGHGLGQDAIDDFADMLNRGITALTDDDISTISVSLV